MALEIVFWVAVGLIVYAHLGYPLLLWALAALFGEDDAMRRARELRSPARAICPASA